MEVITIASAKGGVSKSLLAINLFDYLKRKNEDAKVLLIDTDKQKSAFEFLGELKEEDISAVSTEADFDFVLTQAKKEGYNYVVVDTAPSITPLNAHIIKKSDRVLIAAKPARFDIKSVYNIVDLVQQSNVNSCILFTQTVNNSTNTKKNLDELASIFKKEKMKVLPYHLSHSMVYVNSINELKTIFGTKHTKQKIELTEIYAALLAC